LRLRLALSSADVALLTLSALFAPQAKVVDVRIGALHRLAADSVVHAAQMRKVSGFARHSMNQRSPREESTMDDGPCRTAACGIRAGAAEDEADGGSLVAEGVSWLNRDDVVFPRTGCRAVRATEPCERTSPPPEQTAPPYHPRSWPS
jgi:hypothetical protein